MAKKKVTIEQLAQMVQKGFAQTVSRHEFQLFDEKVGGFRKEMLDFRRDSIERFENIEADLRDVKNALGPLVRIVGNLEYEVRVLHTRLNRVERKVGIK